MERARQCSATVSRQTVHTHTGTGTGTYRDRDTALCLSAARTLERGLSPRLARAGIEWALGVFAVAFPQAEGLRMCTVDSRRIQEQGI